MTRHEIRITERLHEQELLIAGINHKTKFAIEQMNETKWFAVSDVWYTVQEIEGVKREAAGTGQQEVMEEFGTYMTRLAARHTLGAVEVSAGKTAEVISYSIEPPPLPPMPEKPKGFFARIFGG